MPRRGSKRLAKQASRKSDHRQVRPNVYTPTPGGSERNTESDYPSTGDEMAESAVAVAGTSSDVARPRAVRGRQNRARSEVYTQYLPQELRKLGLLTLAIIGILVALTVVLR